MKHWVETYRLAVNFGIDERRAWPHAAAVAPDVIPQGMVRPHEERAIANHAQSLRRLDARGGLDPAEMVAVLEDRPWRRMPLDEAVGRLLELMAAWARGK